MKQTGEKLRQSREEKGISLEEVVIATKIKMSTLKAMEEGDTKKLPSKTFIRGFVQSYAKYLNADEEDILETFYQEMGSTVDIPNNVKATTEMDNRDDSNAMKFANSTRHPLIKIFFAIGAFILVVLIYFVSTTIDKYQEEKQLVKPTQEEAANIEPLVEEEEVAEIVEPENEELAETAKKEEPPTELKPEPKPEKKAEPVKEEVKKEVPENDSVAEDVKEEAPKNEIKPVPVEKKQEEVKETVTEEPKEEAKPEADENTIIPKKVEASFIPQEVIIEALDGVEVEFKTDSGDWVEIDLKPEQIHTIKGKNNIDLRVSDGGAVNIIYNGKDQGVPGTLGSNIELKYPK